jgi:hypothetical protein
LLIDHLVCCVLAVFGVKVGMLIANGVLAACGVKV